jgi:ankyrin repeat protein
MCVALVDLGPKLHAKHEDGRTALHTAANRQRIDDNGICVALGTLLRISETK